jgi:hypothetical protein
MISFRQADLMNSFRDDQVYEPLWNYLRGLRESKVALVRLIREMVGHETEIPMTEIGGLSLPSNITHNYDIVPPEMRKVFMYWVSQEGNNVTSLKSAKDIHDKWINYNNTVYPPS